MELGYVNAYVNISKKRHQVPLVRFFVLFGSVRKEPGCSKQVLCTPTRFSRCATAHPAHPFSQPLVEGQVLVKGQKHGFWIFRHRLRTVNSSVPKISINAPRIKGKSLCTLHAYSKYLQVKVKLRSQKVTMC